MMEDGLIKHKIAERSKYSVQQPRAAGDAGASQHGLEAPPSGGCRAALYGVYEAVTAVHRRRGGRSGHV
jgi:hypothetical protein